MRDENKIKIVIVIPYFGKWPKYFNVFLKSCAYNNWLDIIFFTDCEIPAKKYKNVIFYPSSLEILSALASNKLRQEYNITKPYKLCDFRPCYGLIFEDYLKDYDYWGYGDIDLIYGDLEPFIINKIKDGFDVLSNRKEILSGSLSFFKNTDLLKNLYAKSPVLTSLLQSKNYEGLDETAHDHRTWTGGEKLDLPNHSFTYLIANEDSKGTIKASFTTTCKEDVNTNEIINYRDGWLNFENKSLAYYHYVCNKNKEEFKLPNWQIVPNAFFITTTGFYKNDKYYVFTHNTRMLVGFAKNIFTRVLKRLIK